MIVVDGIVKGFGRRREVQAVAGVSFTAPDGESMMLPGSRSRWTTPLSCAASTPAEIWRQISTASRTGSGPRARCAASVSPSTNSSTR